MKALFSFVILCLFMIQFAAGQESEQMGFPQLNFPIKLHVNGSVFIESENLQITLNQIDDSRCPSDVTCIQAGDAKVRLNLIHDEQHLGNLTLSTVEKNPVSFNGYMVKLVKVDPYPTSTKQIQPTDYLATISISKEKTLSPLQQVTSGILPQDVMCHDGFTLMQKASTDTSVCVKPETAKILVQRNWGIILKDATNTTETPAKSSLQITTDKDQYATGESINLTITNTGNTRLFPIGWGYSISGPNGEHYAPNGVLRMMLVALPPGNSIHWEWNQLDANSTQVNPGQYTITASYSEANTQKQITSSKLVEITS